MKKIILQFPLLLFVLFISTTVFAQVWGNGEVEEQTRSLTGFQSIVSSSSVDVYVRQGDAFSAKVVADGNLIPYIKTEVKNNTLYVLTTKDIWKAKRLEVHVTLKNLQKVTLSGSGDFFTEQRLKTSDIVFHVSGSGDVEAALDAQNARVAVSGSGDVNVQGIRGNLAVEVTGSGDVEATGLQLNDCTVKIAGSGDVELKGRSASLAVYSVGSGDLDASGLTAVKVQVKAKGSGDVYVRAVNSIEGSLVGSGDLHYSGNPAVVKVSTLGSGDVYHR